MNRPSSDGVLSQGVGLDDVAALLLLSLSLLLSHVAIDGEEEW